MIPPFFRYSYFLATVGYQNGVKWVYSVHGYVFTFYEPKIWVKQLVRERVMDYAALYEALETDNERRFEDLPATADPDGLSNISCFEAEEEEQVDVEEVRGVGFYYPRILINDVEAEKADIRRGFWRQLGRLVRRAVRGVLGR